MRIAITGASGLVGKAVGHSLVEAGHTVNPLVRRPPATNSDEIYWKPSANEIDQASLEGVGAVIHLAGESISGRWTDAKRKRIKESRVEGTTLISQTIADLTRGPDVLVSASAVGFYGDRKDEMLTESSAGGAGFLPKVCFAWEAAAEPARQAGIRVVHPRLGIVLSDDGGALSAMLTPFKMGVGGIVGSGKQFMSWIALDDVVRALNYILTHHDIQGAVNLTSPHPVTNKEFTKTLGRVLGRPTLLPLPKPMVQLLMGEMGESLLLDSTRALPQRLLQAGFEFHFRDLEPALRAALKD